MDILLVSFEV